jgi:branched-chain amino acid transport system ATP-binding protein
MIVTIDNEPLLQMNDVFAVYHRASLALSGITLSVPRKSVIALLGANGAGKTTTLKSISNLIALDGGQVTNGTITFDGKKIQRADPEYLVAAGIVQVLEGRRCFSHLSVEENLQVACKKGKDTNEAIEEIYRFFPKLKKLYRSQAGYISGGEQQMLAIGRAILAEPCLLLLDEPSMGVAPLLVAEIYEILTDLSQRRGFSILMAEQSTHLALRYSSYAYVIGNGKVVQEGTAAQLRDDPQIRQHYLGKGGEGRGRAAHRSERLNNWLL